MKICQDKLDTEKIMSFVSVGAGGSDSSRNGGGVSITFSDKQGPRREGEPLSSPSSASSQDCIQSQLAAVKLKLEQKRKKIEDEKKKMELLMSKQREKVGQEAFLRAVAKGMERTSPNVVEGDQEPRKPFILNQQSSKAGTPDVEKNTLDLYQLQRGLQRMSSTSQQQQNISSPQREPFFISKPRQELLQPTQPQQHRQQPPQQQQQPTVHPYFMYPSHPPPPPWYGMMPYPHPYYPGYPPAHPPPPQMLPHQQQPPVQSPSVAPADKPVPLTDKPSLSSSFLEMKR